MFINSLLSFGQSVPSSCIAADSILNRYRDDADNIALEKIYYLNLTFIDSIEIPQAQSDSILNALIAVYNAPSLPVRDTVVQMFDIHKHSNPTMKRISVSADSNLFWMQQLKNGIIPTGYSLMDSLLIAYKFTFDRYNDRGGSFSYHIVYFESDSNYNIAPLTNVFEAIPGVVFSESIGMAGTGDNITATINPDYVELNYSIGWEDCLSGCIRHRHWVFWVDTACGVRFVESYGDQLLNTSIREINDEIISIYPNPFNDYISVVGKFDRIDYSIVNISGQEVGQGESLSGQLNNFKCLLPGLYFLKIQTERLTAQFKVIKQ